MYGNKNHHELNIFVYIPGLFCRCSTLQCTSALWWSGISALIRSVSRCRKTNTLNYLKWRGNLRCTVVHNLQTYLPTFLGKKKKEKKKPYDVLTCDRCQCALFHSICTDLSSASEQRSLFPSNLNLCQHVFITWRSLFLLNLRSAHNQLERQCQGELKQKCPFLHLLCQTRSSNFSIYIKINEN